MGVALGLQLVVFNVHSAPAGKRDGGSLPGSKGKGASSELRDEKDRKRDDGPGKGRGGSGAGNGAAGAHDVAHVHVVADVRAGDETWSLEASPFGVFPVIVNSESEIILVNLKLPHVRQGTSARMKILNEGWLVPANARTGIIPTSRTRKGRWLASSRALNALPPDANRGSNGRWKDRGVLDLRVGPDQVLAFYFHYGANKHGQLVDVNVGEWKYRFEFHLHPPGYDSNR